MKKQEIKVGGHYVAKVNGTLQTVRVDTIRDVLAYRGRSQGDKTVYDVTNLRTGRKLTFRSAAKFRCEAGSRSAGPKATVLPVGKTGAGFEVVRAGFEVVPNPTEDPKTAKASNRASRKGSGGSSPTPEAPAQPNDQPSAGMGSLFDDPEPVESAGGPPADPTPAEASAPRPSSAGTAVAKAAGPGGRPNGPSEYCQDDEPDCGGEPGYLCPGCGKLIGFTQPGRDDVKIGGEVEFVGPAYKYAGGPYVGQRGTVLERGGSMSETLEDGTQGEKQELVLVAFDGDKKASWVDIDRIAVGTKEAEQRSDPRKATGGSGTSCDKTKEGEQGRPFATSAKPAVEATPAKSATAEGTFEWCQAAEAAGYNSDNPPPKGWKPGQPSGLAAKIRNHMEVAKTAGGKPSAPHVEVMALAGTGKTTTAIEGVKEVKGVRSKLTPSPQQKAVWEQLKVGKAGSIRLSAFNTTITDELKKRLTDCGLDRMGCEARGIHSLGNYAVYKQFGKQEASEWTTLDLIGELLGGQVRELRKEAGMATVISATDQLTSLCKQTLTEPTPEGLDGLTSHYDVDITGEARNQVYDLVPQVLDRCRSPKGRISFDDMVWLPVVLGLPIYRVDLQIVDEAQDLNRMQQELVYRAGHRIVYVGDPHQAIYGFAGSDTSSMPNMRAHLGSTGGCVPLALTVTRRCGKAIVAEAQQIVPAFEAHPDNPAGIVREAKYPIRPKSSNYWTQGSGSSREVPWAETYCAEVRGGDRILCRCNAPLVSQCFRFLKKGMKANILGRKVGEGLHSLIKKSKAKSIETLIGWLSDWLAKEMAQEQAKRFPSEQRTIAIQDKHDCLVCFAEDCQAVEDVSKKIDMVFTDTKTGPGILLSSIHKAKGLEANRVFFLQPDGAACPHPMAKLAWEHEQEMNLRYVAITRAIEELIHVY